MSTDNVMKMDAGKEPAPAIDPDEIDKAEKAAAEAAELMSGQSGEYTYKFAKPFEYNGKTYTELSFDWESLTGKDCIDIEDEMAAMGNMVIAKEFNTKYHMVFAAKACTEKNFGSDAFPLMPAKAFLNITREVRNFLLRRG